MLHLKNICKLFGRHSALNSINLKIAEGEIHGIAGINGSGKSTLLNILFGSPIIAETGGYGGEIILQGKSCLVKSPQSAIAAGFGMVHQELAIVPDLSVAENITITREPVFPQSERFFGLDFALIDNRRSHIKASETLKMFGVAIDPQHRAGNLPLNMRQFVEIAREISRDDLKVLLLDEPTAVLNNADSALLLQTLKTLAQKGVTILYVSHRLDEFFSLCDHLTVLRNGEVSGQFTRAGFSHRLVTDCMIGGSVVLSRKSANTTSKKTILSLEKFSVSMPGERIESLDLDIQQGEIVGITSLSGHGKMAIGPGIMGLYPVSGKLILKGDQAGHLDTAAMMSKGVFMLPEDRRLTGLLQHQSIVENIVFAARQCNHRFLRRVSFLPLYFPDQKQSNQYARECISALHISCTDFSQKVRELSGGNQQKVCIAKALAMAPEILIVNEPTRGIDLGSKELILDMFIAMNRDKGTTLLIASSELDELRRICDRIAVLYKGCLLAILSPDTAESVFVQAMSGETPQA
ncbi:MAG: sugar ABC transporter ATP-binding protein [Proteobacteria bacterium]|nr:sugar ABC transporter ATP-binding protein [Pseudomonadota bacterium]